MSKDMVSRPTTPPGLAFKSIELVAEDEVTLTTGGNIQCIGSFFIKSGTLYVSSESGSIVLTLPDIPLDVVTIEAHGDVSVSISTIKQLKITTENSINAELDDFDSVELESSDGEVTFKYNGDSTVCAQCSSSEGEVISTVQFWGDESCDKKLVIEASTGIKLMGGK